MDGDGSQLGRGTSPPGAPQRSWGWGKPRSSRQRAPIFRDSGSTGGATAVTPKTVSKAAPAPLPHPPQCPRCIPRPGGVTPHQHGGGTPQSPGLQPRPSHQRGAVGALVDVPPPAPRWGQAGAGVPGDPKPPHHQCRPTLCAAPACDESPVCVRKAPRRSTNTHTCLVT